MLTTKVINATGRLLLLKEGTAGIQRMLVELQDQKSYTIKVDANATYREYWCAAKHNDPNAVVLSSDDCQEYKVVTIKFRKENNSEIYFWEGVRRDNGKRVEVNDGAKSDIKETPENSPKGMWKWITGFFKQG